MKEFLKSLYKALYNEDLVKTVTIEVPPIKQKTNSDKLCDIAYKWYGKDPTPKDEVSDEVSCVFSLTTILREIVPDFPILSYTPDLLKQMMLDTRFKVSKEFNEGNIVISVTNSGNGRIMGHTGIVGHNGKILSNNSETGLWLDKYDISMWIERYSRQGGLVLYIFELL